MTAEEFFIRIQVKLGGIGFWGDANYQSECSKEDCAKMGGKVASNYFEPSTTKMKMNSTWTPACDGRRNSFNIFLWWRKIG